MSFPVPAFATIQSNILRDISNQSPDAAVGNDSDYSIRAAGEAAAIEGLYAHQQWIYKQIFPDLMDLPQLVMFAADRGLTQKTASSAISTATFTGTIGAALPSGTACVCNGLGFVTTAAATIGIGGTAVVPIMASAAGSAGNIAAGLTLTLSTAPAGINSTAILATTATGGSDAETQAAFLARVLFILQTPPQGGSYADYKKWATDTPGCSYAYIYGQRTLPNSVDIVILDENGNLPTTSLIAAVQANINANRPVTANNCFVSGPAPVPVNITAATTLAGGVVLADVEPLIIAAFTGYFAAMTPGQLVIYNELVNLAMNVTGVVDINFTVPTANVATTINSTVIEIATLGAVALS